MHAFFPGAFFLLPAVLFFGLLKIGLFVLLIVFIVHLATDGRRHAHHVHDPGREGSNAQDLDPRRVAAWRYASGKIDRAEFESIISGLDAAAVGTQPPSPRAPQPPAA